MMLRRITPLALVTLFVAVAARAETWQIDGAHSGVNFSIRHLAISNVRGSFGVVSGTVDYDGKDLAGVKVDVSIDTASVDTHNSKRDDHLRSPDFFDATKYPKITFKSKKSTPGSDGGFKVVGDLTIKDKTKEVVLDVEAPSAEIKGPGGSFKMGATATTKINRQDFGVTPSGATDKVIGDEVKITIDLEIARKAPE